MRCRSAVAICVVVAVVSVAAACDRAEKGNPTPQVTTSVVTVPTDSSAPPPTSTTSLPFAGAPKVSDPLETGKYLSDPCSVLTADQVSRLNVGEGKKSQGNLGPVCDWRNAATGGDINVEFLSGSREGLSAVYQANDQGQYEFFEPVAGVSGFPAVFAGNASDKSLGMCFIYIGLSDELALQLSVTQSLNKQGSAEPCDVTKAVAQVAVQTMKAGA
jgi:hypothetical protein